MSDNKPNRGVENKDGVNVQYGSGWSCPQNWINFDASPSLRIEKMLFFGKFFKVNENRFPDGTFYGDIIKGLPVAPNTAKAVYASHILEHLSYNDCMVALNNTFGILEPEGTFRLVVPDLEARAKQYLSAVSDSDSEAANNFCKSTLLGQIDRPHSLIGKIRSALGNSHHLWMWDERSMKRALDETGFVNIRRCCIGDAKDRAFEDVEVRSRFFDDKLNISELALEAEKPV